MIVLCLIPPEDEWIVRRAFSAFAAAEELPWCRCDGDVITDYGSCLKCGRHMRDAYKPGRVDTFEFGWWHRLMRERPHDAPNPDSVEVFA